MSSLTNAKPANAVLCTRDQTFELRQVQTSNDLHLLRPTTCDATSSEYSTNGVAAIATCASTVELYPVTDKAEAQTLLSTLLPVYRLGMTIDTLSPSKFRYKHTAVANLPFDDAACERAWTDVIAFEAPTGCYRFGETDLLALWHLINNAAIADSINLERMFQIEVVVKLVRDGRTELPGSAVESFIHLLGADEDAKDGWVKIDKIKTVRLVGKWTMLDICLKSGKHEVGKDVFLKGWENNLHAQYHDLVSLELLSDTISQPSPGLVRLVSSAAGPDVTAGDDASAKTNKARKWHDKFRKAK